MARNPGTTAKVGAGQGVRHERTRGELAPVSRAGSEGAFYIGFGVSPRGTRRAVVICNGELIHDPNPKRGGIASVEEAWWLVPVPAMLDALIDWAARKS
jgi:hypothetical protein